MPISPRPTLLAILLPCSPGKNKRKSRVPCWPIGLALLAIPAAGVAQVDLEVTQTVPGYEDDALAGHPLAALPCPTVFEVKVKNNSSTSATNAFLTGMVTSPNNALSATSPAGNCAIDPPCAGENCVRLLRCPLGTIAANGEVTVSISLSRHPAVGRMFSVVGAVADQTEDTNALNNGTSFTIWARRPGDFDGTGVVDVADSLCLQCFIVGNCTGEQYTPPYADYTNPEYPCPPSPITVADVVYLANYVVGNYSCLTQGPACQSRAPALAGAATATPAAVSAVRNTRSNGTSVVDGRVSVPLGVDLSGVTVGNQAAMLGGYLAKVTFDRSAVAFSNVRVGRDKNFKDNPVFTSPEKANRQGYALIIGAHASRTGSMAVVDLATMEFEELKHGGASSIAVEFLQAATPPLSDGKIASIPVSTGGTK